MRTTSRVTGFAAAAVILVALISPAAAASAVPAGEIIGSPGQSGWRDTTLASEMTVGVAYSSTIQGPSSGGPYSAVDETGLPDGLTATLNPTTEVITVSGTPTTAGTGISFSLSYSASGGELNYSIEFDGFTVALDKAPTTTTVTVSDFAHYSAVTFGADVSPSTATGTVAFYLGGALISTVPVDASGHATYTGSVGSSWVGSAPQVYAFYSGDDDYTFSESTTYPSAYIYGPRVITGTVERNRVAEPNAAVRLIDSSFNPTGMSTTTNADGEFSFTLPTPTTRVQAQAGYAIEVTSLGLFYSASGGWGQPNKTSLSDATVLSESGWATSRPVYLNIAPTWVDQTLAQPRSGESYSDSVSATTIGEASDGSPATVTYSLTGDPLPSWLSFNAATGSFSSTGPTDQLSHSFTVVADNGFAKISKNFTLQAGDAAVPPTFTDTDIVDLQVGTAVTDAIAATGDATITYSSTTLPPGLTLNAATGALTGTPTAAGDYVVTFTASNGVNPDATFTWEPTIAAAPDLGLVLNFAAGTTIDDADTEIGADGLKVGSTYTLTMFSTPRILYTGTIDASGAFLHTITLPADTPVGAHELVLTGVAPDGTVLTARAWFTLLSNGRIGAISYAGPLSFSLAATGSSPFVPFGIASALLLAGYLTIRRSRGVRVS